MVTFACFFKLLAGKIVALFPVDMNTQKIHNVVDPTENQEAATKKYVDDQAAGGGDMLKATYDIDENGIVDNSEKLEASTKAQVQDHTPKAHTLASHSTKAHTELTDVSADQHHAQTHTLASHSTKAHTELTGVTADQHHVQAHILDSHSEKKLDQLDEKTPGAGVTVDGCLIKDGKAADSNKLEGSTKAQVRVHEPVSHSHVEADITDLDHDAQKIKSKTVDAPLAADDGKALTYDHANSKYKHVVAGGFPAPDYESFWTGIASAGQNDFVHNLGTDNILVQIWQSDVNNWTNAFLVGYFGPTPPIRVYIQRQSNNVMRIYNGDTGGAHYYMLRMWKW